MTHEIRHRIVIAAAPEVVSAALSEPAKLGCWWTREVHQVDGGVCLGWSGHGWQVALRIDAGADHRQVCWRCERSNMLDTDAWEGTVLRFDLLSVSEGTQLDFVQSGYRDSPCLATCTQRWRFVLGSSLKRYVETGQGMPYPDTPQSGDPALR
ncbi:MULTISPECIES: SRPBCC family protein [Xanthomonas]|uniref:SRPBCC domain-containing protein n=1 Tax=Xanthomonas cucurbitae TaxID=56453 RepID=A0ABY7YC19_9XANT|nr:SRPBCC domain-containing protein [Xanthomonas cucurbitae]WDM67506.1 SRPBCC domain-containing protein [Xanthomonas cucurbitae]WDM71382.1 SRPBCC domain-containing protein [Xanthomonas cucurbitae]WDM75641.1 SRPBCC domain-containing protein [Xanthomonas cucurbitae]WDM79345.1 SRPBCC domain-containing protein [Xanthomonas cucurbitae]WDM83033.1 SRPBCC domain-containing protein [Xanthomonas cucurbitae]